MNMVMTLPIRLKIFALILSQEAPSCYLSQKAQESLEQFMELWYHFYIFEIMCCFPSRSSLQDQNTKVAVVLIQKNAPLPPGKTEDKNVKADM